MSGFPYIVVNRATGFTMDANQRRLPVSEVMQLIAAGWSLYSDIAASVPGGMPNTIVVPGQPSPVGQGGAGIDVWVAPRPPSIPAEKLAQYLVFLMDNGGDLETLDPIAKDLLGISLGDLVRAMRDEDDPGSGVEEETPERDEPVIVPFPGSGAKRGD